MFILEAFNFLSHPTAEEVYAHVYQSLPGISLGTVYKTLDTLVQNQLITKLQSETGSFRYDSNTNSHSHIYCTNTNEIIDFEDPDLQEILRKYFAQKNIRDVKIQDIRLQIYAEKIIDNKIHQ
jgi:Fur family peroxide stress response transcriptional regulator